MKKQILSILTAATMLFATSCSDEEMTYESANKQNVTFKVQVEGAGAGSRTIADGTNHITIGQGQMVNKLFYAVYETGKTECLMEGEATASNGVATVVIPLVNGLKFDLVFLAYNDENNLFGISKNLTFTDGLCQAVDLENLTLKRDLKANQEAYDAFYHVETNYVTNTNSTSPVTLRRMLAQVNVATTDSDLSQAKQLNADITQTAITLKGVPNQFNARTGVATGEVEVSYEVSDILKCSDKADGQTHDNEQLTVNIDGEDKNFNYLAMAYVLAGKDESSLHDTKVSFYRGQGKDTELVHTRIISTLPLQRQYRTNVTGNVLTQQEAFDISLDVDFGNHNESVGDVVVVADAESLQEAIDNATDGVPVEIQLQGNIVLGASDAETASASARAAASNAALLIEEGKEIILDLNGFTISHEYTQADAYAMILNEGTLTIRGTGKISYTDKGNGGSYASNTITNRGTLTVQGGTIENKSSETVAKNGYPYVIDNNSTTANVVLNMEGGKLECEYYCAIRAYANSTTNDNEINIIDGEVVGGIEFQNPNKSANKATLNISGGTISNKATKNVLFIFGSNGDASQMKIDITGGEFTGNVTMSSSMSIGTGFNEQFISGGTFSVDPSNFLADGYKAVQKDNVWVIESKGNPVKIGETEYPTLAEAFEKVQDNETITLLDDVKQADGITITDKKIIIDLNQKTFTVTEGTSTNSRNFLINGTSVVTIKNGTMVAGGDKNSGAFGTIRTEGTANVTLENVKLYNYRGNGLNVKALEGTTVIISDSEVYSQYGGGIEAAGGTVELNNVKVEQKGMWTAPYNSMAISVNGGGTATVNSGTYSTECLEAADAYNQGTSHGPWAAGVLNSGGTLIIKGGTFSNDNFGDNSSASAARGLLLADTGANIQIEGGTFQALKNIVDVTNNLGDASKNPSVTLSGGTFSANPTISGLHASELIKLAEGYEAVEVDGTWFVKEGDGSILVTPENLASTTFESNCTYKLMGDFKNQNVSLVMAEGVENVVFDGSGATNINELIITQNGQLIDNANDIKGERSGKVTIQKFNVLSQINVFACKTEVVVEENTAEALMVHAGNCAVKVLNNVIDANFESHPTYKDAATTWNTNDYGIALNIFDYNLWLDGNTVTDATGHAIGINGWEGTFDTGDDNKIESFVDNKITVNSTTKTKRAALKIWDDETYASNDENTKVVNATAQAFIDAVLQDGSNTFTITEGYEHTIFCFYEVNTNGESTNGSESSTEE